MFAGGYNLKPTTDLWKFAAQHDFIGLRRHIEYRNEKGVFEVLGSVDGLQTFLDEGVPVRVLSRLVRKAVETHLEELKTREDLTAKVQMMIEMCGGST